MLKVFSLALAMTILTAASGQVAYNPLPIPHSEDPHTPMGGIKGRVATADGRPAAGVSVVLPGSYC